MQHVTSTQKLVTDVRGSAKTMGDIYERLLASEAPISKNRGGHNGSGSSLTWKWLWSNADIHSEARAGTCAIGFKFSGVHAADQSVSCRDRT